MDRYTDRPTCTPECVLLQYLSSTKVAKKKMTMSPRPLLAIDELFGQNFKYMVYSSVNVGKFVCH